MRRQDPAPVAVRVIDQQWLRIDINGEKAREYDFGKVGEADENMIKGIEETLTALGYVPDLERMYMDMNLTVLKFYRKE